VRDNVFASIEAGGKLDQLQYINPDSMTSANNSLLIESGLPIGSSDEVQGEADSYHIGSDRVKILHGGYP
jgi:hypothetical protein